MLSLSSPIQPHPDVVVTRLDNGEAVLMHMGTASYFTLNSTGAQIWALLAQGLPPAAIVDQLVADYAVEIDRATASVQALVTQLTEQQLVMVAAA